MVDLYEETLHALLHLDLKRWLEGLREVREMDLTQYRRQAPDNCGVVVKYILELGSLNLGFPGRDMRFLLRLLLEACRPDESVEYDLTDLVVGEVFQSSADMAAYAEHTIEREHRSYLPVVVLTEGSSDRWILERSLKLLHPHLTGFFSFMDFKGARVEGGAGVLANLVKAFVGAGISNRVIALFDNDTGGRLAIQSLSAIQLPENIVALNLPNLRLAENYPTQGPTGISEMNINGLACSLEIYLGEDVLRAEDGAYRPIEWTVATPVQAEQDSGVKANSIPG